MVKSTEETCVHNMSAMVKLLATLSSTPEEADTEYYSHYAHYPLSPPSPVLVLPVSWYLPSRVLLVTFASLSCYTLYPVPASQYLLLS